MMKITGLSHLFKWENLHNWWLTKYFFAPLYIYFFLFLISDFFTTLTCTSKCYGQYKIICGLTYIG